MSDVGGGVDNRLGESISALVDGEADELELRRILAHAESRRVRETWRDMHLQRDMLAGVDMRFAHLDISARVQAALAEEPAAARNAGRWWRPLASVAVAASVASIVVIGARTAVHSSDGAAVVAQTQSAFNAQPTFSLNRSYPVGAAPAAGNVAVNAQFSDLIPANGVQQVALDPNQLAQQRLQQYLLRHTERAALNNGQGVINFAKVSQLNNAQ